MSDNYKTLSFFEKKNHDICNMKMQQRALKHIIGGTNKENKQRLIEDIYYCRVYSRFKIVLYIPEYTIFLNE